MIRTESRVEIDEESYSVIIEVESPDEPAVAPSAAVHVAATALSDLLTRRRESTD